MMIETHVLNRGAEVLEACVTGERDRPTAVHLDRSVGLRPTSGEAVASWFKRIMNAARG
jgi:hypothetical protein